MISTTTPPKWSEVSQEEWDEYIESDRGQVVREVLDPIMLDQIEPHGKSVMDLGCGEGYFARVLRSAHASRVVGVDISPDLIRRAQEHDPSGEYQVHDVADGPPCGFGTFEAVSAYMVLMDLPDLDVAYQCISASLAPGGRFVACMVNPYYAFPVGDWGWALKTGLYRQFDPKHRKWKTVLRQIQGVFRSDFDLILYIRNYFERRVVEKMLGNESTSHFHRPFSDYLNLAAKNGLELKLLVEPQIATEVRERHPDDQLAKALEWAPMFFVMVFSKAAKPLAATL